MIRPAPGAIHLDSSFLIRALVAGSTESMELRRWLRDGRLVAVSTFAWGEFLCGPLAESDEPDARRIARRHMPMGSDEARDAARLFNHGGRRRGSFPDCIIAATAILQGAALATSNPRDFERFAEAGLELAE